MATAVLEVDGQEFEVTVVRKQVEHQWLHGRNSELQSGDEISFGYRGAGDSHLVRRHVLVHEICNDCRGLIGTLLPLDAKYVDGVKTRHFLFDRMAEVHYRS